MQAVSLEGSAMDDAQRRCASPPHAARCAAENCAAAGSAKIEPASAKLDAAATVNIILFIATPCPLLRCITYQHVFDAATQDLVQSCLKILADQKLSDRLD
jgi:hypothetical protein